jgi:DNA topoisomerase-1
LSKNLVIVESPAKAKTIKKYLGKDFEVMASYGHVRDLVPKDGAVETDNKFRMNYQVIDRNAKHVNAIGTALKSADALYLATDPDREGEAIAWHLTELLKERKLLKDKPVMRVVFYEITEKEVKQAVANPREISGDLVNAQQARRALDYLVGFNLSPLLWRKVAPGLSAGRVQSPALRLICEREEEIKKFVPQEYWTVDARADKNGQAFTAKLVEYDGAKLEQFTLGKAGDADKARRAIEAAAGGKLTVSEVKKQQRRRNPSPPFTTSTLQQEANKKLGFTAKRTMRAAQDLFEGADIHGELTGLITYMRTDSVNLSNDAITEIRELVAKRYGKKALPDEPRVYKSKSKNAQEAHEAVRPTSAARTPDSVAKYLTPDQARLYELIWKRAVASQMEAALFDTVAVTLSAGQHAFRANGQTLIEPGYLAAYDIQADDPAEVDHEDDEARLPPLEQGDVVKLLEVIPEQHFTEPPPRYTEASLVKTLEEFDIGRPSTYASIINTLVARRYVDMQGKAFIPTDTGLVVNRFLTAHFAHYVDYKFTAHFEDELDEISRGEREWQPVLQEFWDDFKPTVDEKMELKREDVSEIRQLGTDPASGKPVSARLGRFGPFVQIGTRDDPEKPRFASLRGNQRLDTLTLEQALELFLLPRKLGASPEGEDVLAAIGRFGPYVKFGTRLFVSLRKEDDPYTVTLERALELRKLKLEALDAATLKRFDDSKIRVIKGRFGPYIQDEGRRARIPKGKDYASLTLEECVALLDEQNAKGRKKKKKVEAPAAPAAEAKPAAKKARPAAKKKPAAKKASVS